MHKKRPGEIRRALWSEKMFRREGRPAPESTMFSESPAVHPEASASL